MGDLVSDIPYLIFWEKIIPPYKILNDLLNSGISDAGMSGGCEWEPFTITNEEYQELIEEFDLLPGTPDPSIPIPDHVKTRIDWMNWMGDWRFQQTGEMIGFPNSSTFMNKINDLLGIAGKHHRIINSYSQLPVPSGCIEWNLPMKFDKTKEFQEIDTILTQVRAAIEKYPVLAYKSISSFQSIRTSISNKIVICPSIDQFDILRYEQGSKFGFQKNPELYKEILKNIGVQGNTELDISHLRKIDEQFGIDILGASRSIIEFQLLNIPVGEQAQIFKKNLYEFCPDILELIYNASTTEFDFDKDDPMNLLAEYDLGDGRIVLWWD